MERRQILRNYLGARYRNKVPEQYSRFDLENQQMIPTLDGVDATAVNAHNLGQRRDGPQAIHRPDSVPQEDYGELPTLHPGHVRQFVGDALVAIDTGFLSAGQRRGVLVHRPVALLGEVHELKIMTVPAFQRVVSL